MGKIAHMLDHDRNRRDPADQADELADPVDRGAAGFTMVGDVRPRRLAGASPWTTLFDTAVALAIAAIPLALPMVVQVVLSLGSVELAKEKAIVKDLPSVETLGFTSAINSDKTGTLTMNQMTAVEVVSATDRYAISGPATASRARSPTPPGRTPMWTTSSSPTSWRATPRWSTARWSATRPRVPSWCWPTRPASSSTPPASACPGWPPCPSTRATSSWRPSTGRPTPRATRAVRCFVKGAAPAVLERAATALADGRSVPWDDTLSQKAQEHVQRMGEAGLRVMAGAYRDIEVSAFDPDGDLLGYVKDLEMASLVGMVDPPRAESKVAVADAIAAHIRVRMVTGDDVVTGAAIAKQLDIPGGSILGAEFAALSEEERLARIDDIGVLGRVAPEHKVLLAETLKKKGDVVAMTGDGVNDAPAIKAADIGVAMGSGTEVAKNAGRMILSDDNFATIVYAVEQGRKLYDNLNKYIRFVLLELVAFVLTFLGATLLNLAGGQPFTPVQILWINFLVNAPFGVALGFDQQSPGLMRRRPRPRGDSILTTPVLVTCGLVGLYVAAANLGMIALGINHYGSVPTGQSMGLVAFTLMLVVAAFEARSETGSVLTA